MKNEKWYEERIAKMLKLQGVLLVAAGILLVACSVLNICVSLGVL